MGMFLGCIFTGLRANFFCSRSFFFFFFLKKEISNSLLLVVFTFNGDNNSWKGECRMGNKQPQIQRSFQEVQRIQDAIQNQQQAQNNVQQHIQQSYQKVQQASQILQSLNSNNINNQQKMQANNNFTNESSVSARDLLAMERTKLAMERTSLANERTLLAYTRTSLTFFAAAGTLIQFFENKKFVVAGYFFVPIGIILLLIGGYSYFHSKKLMKKIELVK